MWLIAGLLLGIGLVVLVLWLRSRGIAVSWYEWVIMAIGLVLAIFTLQNYFASVAEYEPIAPGMFLLVFGLPSLVLILISVFLVWFRWFRKTLKARSEAEITAS